MSEQFPEVNNQKYLESGKVQELLGLSPSEHGVALSGEVSEIIAQAHNEIDVKLEEGLISQIEEAEGSTIEFGSESEPQDSDAQKRDIGKQAINVIFK